MDHSWLSWVLSKSLYSRSLPVAVSSTAFAAIAVFVVGRRMREERRGGGGVVDGSMAAVAFLCRAVAVFLRRMDLRVVERL